jgi:hypothetical protein
MSEDMRSRYAYTIPVPSFQGVSSRFFLKVPFGMVDERAKSLAPLYSPQEIPEKQGTPAVSKNLEGDGWGR